MIHRFFVPGADTVGAVVTLPEDEAAHLTRVLRLTSGDAVRAFDGRGHEWSATVGDIGRHRVTLVLGEPARPAPEAGVAITLAAAVLKGEKMDDVIRDAVMLGVVRIQPLISERTEVSLAVIERSGRVARWQRIAIASAKQCGRAVVPGITAAASVMTALDRPAVSARVVLVEPRRAHRDVRLLRDLERSRAVELLVGPEGGWTDVELDQAVAAGSMLVTLGEQTLRANAAPLVAISALRALWKDL